MIKVSLDFPRSVSVTELIVFNGDRGGRRPSHRAPRDTICLSLVKICRAVEWFVGAQGNALIDAPLFGKTRNLVCSRFRLGDDTQYCNRRKRYS